MCKIYFVLTVRGLNMRPVIGLLVGMCLILSTQIGGVGSFELEGEESSEFFALLIGI